MKFVTISKIYYLHSASQYRKSF